ncbi:MAG: ABC transporter substrate-binding protein [Acidimicrobiales bacterium]
MMQPTKMRHLVAAAVVVVLSASACTASDDEPVQAVPPSTELSGTAAPSTQTTVAPLTASFRGVTADTITLGVLTADLEAIRDVVDIDNGDVGLVYETMIDDLNARGGIGGRQIDMHLVKYSPLEMVDAERACVDLTEDHAVFAVIGAFFGPVRATNTCLNGANETIIVGGTQTPELLAQTRAPWISDGMSAERRFRATIDLYAREGLLDDHTIAVIDTASEHGITEQALLPAFDDLGLARPTVLTSDSAAGDVAALASEIAVFSERIASQGVDLVLLANSQVPLGFGLLRDNGYSGDIYAVEEGPQLGEIGGYDASRDPAIYDGAIGSMGLTDTEAFELESTQTCIDTFEAANPAIDVQRSDLVPDGEADWLFTLYGACRLLRIFELAAAAAGPELTNDSFAAGAATLTSFETAGRPYNSLSDTKTDAGDGLRLGVFDSTIPPAGGLAPLTEFTDIG